jgi:8-oxo-dGTP pyrophosphatase MutT (NUDIX family)
VTEKMECERCGKYSAGRYCDHPDCQPVVGKRAAVAYVTREDGRMLVVWNKRYAGWAMPGGLVEEGEELHQGMARELLEETGLHVSSFKNIYDGPTEALLRDGRGSHVFVFRVTTKLDPEAPHECEVGCPVTWLTREEFLAWSPFYKFYEKMFEELKK